MYCAKMSPRALAGANAGSSETELHYTFPRCELHGSRLVSALPAGCPFRAESALQATQFFRDRGYARLAPGPEQSTAAGLADLARAETCYQCICKFLTHPVIQRLREQARREKQATPQEEAKTNITIYKGASRG